MTKRTTRTAVVAGLVAAVALLAAGCGSSSDAAGDHRRRHDGHDGREGDQGRPDHRPRPAQRQRLQRARLQRAQAGGARARRQGTGRRVQVGGRLRPEHDDARAAGLRPDHRRRLRAGRRDRDGREEVSRTRSSRSSTSTRRRSRASRRTSRGLLFREQQVGYLAGYLAALEAKRAGGNRISAVGGFKEPPVDRYIAGYQAGAKAAVPGIVVKWGYSQDWDDQAKCKELALNQIAAGLEGRLPGRRRLRPRRAARREGAEGLGHRRRRRPVVPRPARADERAQGRRQRRVPDRQGGAGRDVQGRRQCRLRPRPGRRRPRQVQPERRQGGHRGDGEGRAADRRRQITDIPTTLG